MVLEDSKEEDEALLTLAEAEGLAEDLRGSDESLEFLRDTELEELEPLVDLDEEEEVELLDSFEELVVVRLEADDMPELCLSLLALEDCLLGVEL